MRRNNTRVGQVQVAARPTAISRPGLRKASEENMRSGHDKISVASLKRGIQVTTKANVTKSGIVESSSISKRSMLSVASENEPVVKLSKILDKKTNLGKGCEMQAEVIKAVVSSQVCKGLRAVSKNAPQQKPLMIGRSNIPTKPSDLAVCAKSDVSCQPVQETSKLPTQAPSEESTHRRRVTRSLSRKLLGESGTNEVVEASGTCGTSASFNGTKVDQAPEMNLSSCASANVASASAPIGEKTVDNSAHHCAQCNAPVLNKSDSACALDSVSAAETSSSQTSSTKTSVVARDPLALSDFVDEIFFYYRSRELRYVPDDYLRVGITRSCSPATPAQLAAQSRRILQSNLTPFMRAVLVDWLVEIQLTFELTHEPLYIAVRLLDTYLSRSRSVLPVSRLQLLGLICMLLGTKYEERQPPAFADLLELCDNAYTEEDLISMELDVLQTVGYDLGAPLSYRFLRRYANVINESLETLTLARYVLEVTLMLYDFVVELDSEMAAAALLLALLIKRVNRSQLSSVIEASLNATQQNDDISLWPAALVQASGYRESALYSLVRKLNQAVPMKIYPKLQTVRCKYSQEPFFFVAKNYRQLTEEEIVAFERSARERDCQQIEAERLRLAAETEERCKLEALKLATKLCARCAAASNGKPACSSRRLAMRCSK